MKVPLPIAWPPPTPIALPWELALKAGLSAGLGLYLAHLLDLDFPVYVLLAVATCVETSGPASWLLAGYRVLGTLLALPVALLVVYHWSVTPFSVGIVMGTLVVVCTALGLRNSSRLAMLVFAVGVTEFTSEIDAWAEGRLVATLVGVAVTVVISAVPMPVGPLRPRHRHHPDVPPGFIVRQE